MTADLLIMALNMAVPARVAARVGLADREQALNRTSVAGLRSEDQVDSVGGVRAHAVILKNGW